MVGHQRVGPSEVVTEVRHTHPRLVVGDGACSWARGMGQKNEHPEPQRISDGPKAAKKILSSRREQHARSDAGQAPRPHRVRLHRTRWVRVLQKTDLTRTFVLGVFTRVVQMPYRCVQETSPGEGSETQAPHSSALNLAVGSLL